MRNISKNLFARPRECLEEVDELVNRWSSPSSTARAALHVMGEHAAGEEAYFHGLNVSILSMMLAKDLGFTRSQSQLLGVGALLHDVGLADVPPRTHRPPEARTHHPERNLRELHCDYGVRLGKQIGLPEPVLRIIAQHHELADGSGYPRRLKGDQIDPLARLVALVNYYDNLCNPGDLAKALTPHEALVADVRPAPQQFDARPCR